MHFLIILWESFYDEVMRCQSYFLSLFWQISESFLSINSSCLIFFIKLSAFYRLLQYVFLKSYLLRYIHWIKTKRSDIWQLNNEKHHCLKVFGLLALKTVLYLLWLALWVALRMGNLRLFSLNKCDLGLLISSLVFNTTVLKMEMVSLEALWLPAISWCNWLTAPFNVVSLYYLYMLWIPVLDWYFKTIPKVLTWPGLLS